MSPFDLEYLGQQPTKGYKREESDPYTLILVASVIINIISSFLISQG